MCIRWMAIHVKRTRWDIRQCLLGILHKKRKVFASAQVVFWHYNLLYRVAASMEGAKPKTDSASTSGERVSLIFNWFCIDKSEKKTTWISIITHLAGVLDTFTLDVVVCIVSLRGNGGRQVLLWEAQHWRDWERQLWEGQRHLDPV